VAAPRFADCIGVTISNMGRGDIMDSTIIIIIIIIIIYRVSKKTSTHIIGYKLRNGCPILIIFNIKIPHIIWHRKTV